MAAELLLKRQLAGAYAIDFYKSRVCNEIPLPHFVHNEWSYEYA